MVKTKPALEPETSSFTKIAKLAKENRWESIPPQSLTRELLLRTDSEGNNLLHLMAEHHQVSLLPTLVEKEILEDVELLWEPLTHCNKVGTCPLNIIRLNEDLNKLPMSIFDKKWFKLKVPNGSSLLGEWLTQLGKLPWVVKQLDPKTLISKEYGKTMPIHTIAFYCSVHLLTPEQLTPEVINSTDKLGDTVIHKCTHFEGLRHLPRNILTEENLNRKNKDGRSPIQQIIADPEWSVPTGSFNGFESNLNNYPDFLITEKNLLIKNYDNNTTLKILLEIHKEDKDRSTIQRLLGKLKSSTLETLLKEKYPASIKDDIKKVLAIRQFLKEEQESELTI